MELRAANIETKICQYYSATDVAGDVNQNMQYVLTVLNYYASKLLTNNFICK